MAIIEVHVPDMGNFKDVAVIDLLVKPGDDVQLETPLVTLETEKATIDVPSTAAGKLQKLHVGKGDKVSAGSLIATVVVEGDGAGTAGAGAPAAAPAAAPATPPAAAAAAPAAAPAAPAASRAAAAPPTSTAPTGAAPTPSSAAVDEIGFSKAHAGPSVRKLARELGVDLVRVKGSGQKGRISHDDVKSYVKQALSAAPANSGSSLPQLPAIDFAQFGAVEVKPLNRIQKISGPRLHASWVNIPHVTQFDEADVTELEEVRNGLKARAQSQGIKLTPLAFIVRACVKALQQFPTFNTSLDPSLQNLIFKKYLNIGFAADTPNGLMVPVIKDADRKDIYEIARLLGELSEKARAGKLSGAEMQGGCFSISSLGGIGGTAFTPIIVAPEVAILGVSRTATKPVFRDNAFVPRQILPLSLSYDHRVIDGALGARFTTFLAQTLANPQALLEAVP
jgi:pyruvate dehydrogenase E2 component (dihydrolipoamide acetyltransferase)